MTIESTQKMAEKYVTDDDMWYVDTYDSYDEVGMEDVDSMSNFLNHLERVGVYYETMGQDEVRVYR